MALGTAKQMHPNMFELTSTGQLPDSYSDGYFSNTFSILANIPTKINDLHYTFAIPYP